MSKKCKKCDNWYSGEGSTECLRCDVYQKEIPSIYRGRRTDKAIRLFDFLAPIEDVIDEGDFEELFYDPTEEFEQKIDLELFIDKLSDKQKQVIKLYLKGYSWNEIGKNLQRSIGAIRANYRKAIKNMKKYATP